MEHKKNLQASYIHVYTRQNLHRARFTFLIADLKLWQHFHFSFF